VVRWKARLHRQSVTLPTSIHAATSEASMRGSDEFPPRPHTDLDVISLLVKLDRLRRQPRRSRQTVVPARWLVAFLFLVCGQHSLPQALFHKRL
jgi:hypothetical protein